MTIYTPSLADKKPGKDVAEPEVVTEPLTGDKDKEAAAIAANELRVSYLRAKRRSAIMHMLLAIIVVTVLGLGIIGCVELYRHLNKEPQKFEGWCGTQYYDEIYHQTSEPDGEEYPDKEGLDHLEENYIVNQGENYEEFYVPPFDEVRESHVLHDFSMNVSVITDHAWQRCYVTVLKKSIIRPSDFVIRIDEVTSAGHTRRTLVIREDYLFYTPPRYFSNKLGRRISELCGDYDLYWLNLVVHGNVKRSAEKASLGKLIATYAMLSNNPSNPEMYKMQIYEPSE